MELSYWPDLDKEESTKEVFDFVKLLNKQLEEKYQKKIRCKLSPIVYGSNNSVYDSKELASSLTSLLKPFGAKTELPSDEEKDKTAISLPSPKEYKFIVFDDECFFRVFDLKASNYFPLFVKPAEGISSSGEYKKIENQSDFEQTIYSYLNSQYLKDVMRYMVFEESEKNNPSKKNEKVKVSL